MSHPVSVLNKYPAYEAIIGIEVHVQLTTKSKIFCSSAHHVSKEPNTDICVICAGYPGVLPLLNKQVVDYAIRAGLATQCTIAHESSFDRKHYFYPDLPKNYQITQQFQPICTEGYVPIRLESGTVKKIRITRIHMEEDAGKSLHSGKSGESFVDLNRAGTPLLEIVSKPDIANAHEAKLYLKTVRAIVQYLGICTGNMEDGAFRADTNVSVRKKGDPTYGIRVELKNINSFKFVSDAIEYEIERHISLLEAGKKVEQETRSWDPKNHTTAAMRSKEEAADYRYFADPDLPTIRIDTEWIDRVRKQLPELPHEKFDRFTTKEGLSEYEADILIEDYALANYFDQAQRASKSKRVINWVLRDVLGYLKEHNIEFSEFKVTPQKLATIADLLESGKINGRTAQELFLDIAQSGGQPELIVKERGLEQISSLKELEELVKEVITNNPAPVTAYQQGNERLFGFFVGQIMKKTQGKGDPQVIQTLLKKHLKVP